MRIRCVLIMFAFISNSLFSQVFVNENMNVTLANDVNLVISGNFKNNGNVKGTGFLKLTQDNSQIITGNGILEKLSIDKNGGQADITAGNQNITKLFVIHGGTFYPHGRLTMKSDASLTAQIGINTGGIINGDFIIERYIPKSNRAYRYISSPVLTSGTIKANLQEGQNNTDTISNSNTQPGFGTHITGSKNGTNGFDATKSGNPSMFIWHNGPQNYTAIPNTETKTIERGESFALFVRGSRATNLNLQSAIGPSTTLRLTGNPTILNFLQNISLTESQDDSFVLIGNPYHGTINANSFLTNNINLNSVYLWVFDPSLNAHGGWATVTLSNGENQQGSSANQFIQPWQSVFVSADNTNSPTFNLSFSENDKNVAEPQVEIFSLSTKINLKLQIDNKTVDGVALNLKQGANPKIDKNDALKFWNEDENISIYSHNRYVSVEERDFPQTRDTIMIRIDQKRTDNYKLVIDGSNFSQTNAILKDFYLDVEYPLVENNNLAINYQVVDGEPDVRFGFIVGSESLSTEEFTSEDFKLYPNPATDKLNIEALNASGQDLKFEIYSLLGKKVTGGDFGNKNKISNYDISLFSSGVYLVVITDDQDLKETIKFIKI